MEMEEREGVSLSETLVSTIRSYGFLWREIDPEGRHAPK